ncbi:MAG: DinB family protein [Rhodobacteraceae bacterium]|nr:DinB family protein [Paracoccaceae bacterium]
MIRAAYVQTMARYNVWENQQLTDAVQGLSQDVLDADRGAFFGSMFATMNHLLWADGMWMSRFDPAHVNPPAVAASDHKTLTPNLDVWMAERVVMNAAIVDWAGRLTDDALEGDLSWHSGLLNMDVTKPLALCVTHMFNHQTHHRGQLHQMLSELGKETPVSDLIFLPEEA